VCHGFAQLASRFLRRFEPLARQHRIIVAPEALNRFYIDTSPRPHGPEAIVGATWMTREDREHEISDYVRYLDDLHGALLGECGARRPSLLLMGFSQGVTTACRWFTLGRAEVQRLVLWSGNIPSDLPVEAHPDRWRATEVNLVWGDRDARAHVDGIQRDEARLAAIEVRAISARFEGGHELNPEVLAEIAARG
jgi:predicted esterase